MVRCWRTRAETGIIQTEIGSVRLVMLMINYASAERLGWRWRRSWICDTERNSPLPSWQPVNLYPAEVGSRQVVIEEEQHIGLQAHQIAEEQVVVVVVVVVMVMV